MERRLEELKAKKAVLIAGRKIMIDDARKDLLETREDLYKVSRPVIRNYVLYFFFNLALALYYEMDRTTFHVVLQTVHLCGIAAITVITLPTFKMIRRVNIHIKEALKRLDKLCLEEI
jgi:hypothetical protein